MKLTVVSIGNKNELALYNDGKLALLKNYGITKKRIKDLDQKDFSAIEKIKDFSTYEYKFESLVDKTSNIICIGLNYSSHIEETKSDIPEYPLLFLKSNNALAGNTAEIIAGNGFDVDYEGELGVMIGKKTRNIREEDALDNVLGYFIGNDVSSRFMQFKTSQWFIGKSFDNFFPNGPYLLTADEIPDPQNLNIKTYLNNELRQNSNTKMMIYPVGKLIAYISKFITLMPGDVISTGTPSGVILGMPKEKRNWIKPGDVVTVEIDKLGTLKNKFV